MKNPLNNTKFKAKNDVVFFIIFLICLSIFASLIFRLLNKQKHAFSDTDLAQLAAKVIVNCQDSKYKPDCYDKQIPLLMTPPISLSMDQAFKVSKHLQKQVDNYGFCHVLGHKIASYETLKDPSKWKEVISRCPSGTCSNGCIHGAFQERFRSDYLEPGQVDSIKPELSIVCRKRPEWSPSGIEQGSCYHALGHLTMYITNADIPKSIALCKELAISESGVDYTQVCFDGVYMQIFQPLEPEDFALVKDKAPDKTYVKDYCLKFDPESFGSCWSESWPLFNTELQTVQGSLDFCNVLSNYERNRCFTSLFYRSPIQLKFDSQRNLDFCRQFPQDLKGLCFAQVALRYVQTEFDYIDKAVDFCQQSIQYDPNQLCFEELALRASYNFQKGSKELETMCNKLPNGWQKYCQDNSF